MYIRSLRAFENESFNIPHAGCITDMPEHMAQVAITNGDAVEVTSDEWIAYRTRDVESATVEAAENAAMKHKPGRKVHHAGTHNAAGPTDIFE